MAAGAGGPEETKRGAGWSRRRSRACCTCEGGKESVSEGGGDRIGERAKRSQEEGEEAESEGMRRRAAANLSQCDAGMRS